VNHADKLADQTPLYYAAKKGHTEMCKLLVERGAEVAHADKNNKTAADLARKYKYHETADYLAGELKRYREQVKFNTISQSV
jgi:ankyrin repeat protein